MTVDNPNVIDFISHDPKTDVVSLVLVEFRDWGDSGLLLPDLQSKLNTYLAFVLDGQLAEECPEYLGRRLCIDLRTVFPLGPREIEFLNIVREGHLKDHDIELRWSVIPSDQPWPIDTEGRPIQ